MSTHYYHTRPLTQRMSDGLRAAVRRWLLTEAGCCAAVYLYARTSGDSSGIALFGAICLGIPMGALVYLMLVILRFALRR